MSGCAPAGSPPRFPLFVSLVGARCLVVGAGAVGRRRAEALASHGAVVRVVDPRAAEAWANEAAPGSVELVLRPFLPGDEESCSLAVAATSDRETNRLVGERCRAAGIPVSVADAPDECTFFFPALCETEELCVGVVSRGGDHALVARVAEAIRALIA